MQWRWYQWALAMVLSFIVMEGLAWSDSSNPTKPTPSPPSTSSQAPRQPATKANAKPIPLPTTPPDEGILTVTPQQSRSLGQFFRGLRSQLVRKSLKQQEIEEIQRQIAADTMPIPKRLGAIFVPSIIRRGRALNRARPPSYLVFNERGEQVARALTGRKAFVYPGIYNVRVGTRNTDVLPSYKVRVYKGKLTVIRPKWAALVVRVVDERLVQFRGGYDIIDLKTRRSVGTGLGADDALGEKVRPWLLPPGLYMIVRVGDSYLARTDYFTVQLNQGKVTVFRLVSDPNTGRFLGGGIRLRQRSLHKRGNWRWNFQLNGNFIWNQKANVPSTKNGHSFNLTSFIFGRLIYNTQRHFFSSTLNFELGFTAEDFNFRKGADRLELQSIYIFRLLRNLGPYVRLGLETSVFPTNFSFLQSDNQLSFPVLLFDCNPSGNQRNCQLRKSIKNRAEPDLLLSGVFDPFLLREGVGINLRAIRRSWLNVRLLLGIGFRQELARQAFQVSSSTRRCVDPNARNPNDPLDLSKCPDAAQQQDSNTNLLIVPRRTTHREGVELALIATGSISRFFTFTTEFEALAQFSNFLDFDVDWRTSLILRLSHYASVVYRLRVRRDPSINTAFANKWFLDQSVVLSFSLLF